MNHLKKTRKSPTTRYCARKALEDLGLPKHVSMPKWLKREEIAAVVAVMRFNDLSVDDAICLYMSTKEE